MGDGVPKHYCVCDPCLEAPCPFLPLYQPPGTSDGMLLVSSNIWSVVSKLLKWEWGQWRIYIVKFWTLVPRLGPISFIFMQFSANFGQIIGCLPFRLVANISVHWLSWYSTRLCTQNCAGLRFIISAESTLNLHMSTVRNQTEKERCWEWQLSG